MARDEKFSPGAMRSSHSWSLLAMPCETAISPCSKDRNAEASSKSATRILRNMFPLHHSWAAMHL